MKFLKIKAVTLAVIILLLPAISRAKISQRELVKNNDRFLSMVMKDNPLYRKLIRECLDSIIIDRNSGTRLLDRFGIFLYDCDKNGIKITKSRFYFQHDSFTFFIVLEDNSDGQLYNFFHEYSYNRSREVSYLKDLHFSLVFNEKMKTLMDLFNNGEGLASDQIEKKSNGYRRSFTPDNR